MDIFCFNDKNMNLMYQNIRVRKIISRTELDKKYYYRIPWITWLSITNQLNKWKERIKIWFNIIFFTFILID